MQCLDDADRIERAAYEGGAQDLIKDLPKEFDEGVDLSGGEWQKIALSRTFMPPQSASSSTF